MIPAESNICRIIKSNKIPAESNIYRKNKNDSSGIKYL